MGLAAPAAGDEVCRPGVARVTGQVVPGVTYRSCEASMLSPFHCDAERRTEGLWRSW